MGVFGFWSVIMNWLKKLRALQNFVMLDILSKQKQLYIEFRVRF
jgi:hypothetical protein